MKINLKDYISDYMLRNYNVAAYIAYTKNTESIIEWSTKCLLSTEERDDILKYNEDMLDDSIYLAGR